jgi:hypothetical protein
MSNPSGSGVSGDDDPRQIAKDIADQVAPLVRRSRACAFDFLAYLLAMALRESRHVSEE